VGPLARVDHVAAVRVEVSIRDRAEGYIPDLVVVFTQDRAAVCIQVPEAACIPALAVGCTPGQAEVCIQGPGAASIRVHGNQTATMVRGVRALQVCSG
jgi:hypothetical protein